MTGDSGSEGIERDNGFIEGTRGIGSGPSGGINQEYAI